MPSALVTTAGAVNANAYCSRAEATAYNDDLPRADVRAIWTSASDDDQDRAILYATKLLDRAFTFIGNRVTSAQPLDWPRYVYGFYTGSGGGGQSSYSLGYGWAPGASAFYIDPTTIPDRVKHATAEYARQLIADDRTADPPVATSNDIKRLKADVVEIEYRDTVVVEPKPVPDTVAMLLAGLGVLTTEQRSVQLVRV